MVLLNGEFLFSKEIKCWFNVCMSCLNLCTICFLKKSYQSIIRNIIHNNARFVLWIMFLEWKYLNFFWFFSSFCFVKRSQLIWSEMTKYKRNSNYITIWFMLVFDELALIYSLSFILQSAKLTSNFLI